MADSLEFYYFGCKEGVGHYLHNQAGQRVHKGFPFGNIDYIFCPVTNDENVSVLTQSQGWSILAMRDYSIDKRPGSNAAFIAKGELTTVQMFHFATEFFPQIVDRLAAFKSRAKQQAGTVL